jgi:predicted NBD/HSP70 family sugar kinase
VQAKNINPKTIRAENRKKILRQLILKREMTLQDLSRELRISVPTVTKNIDELIADGLAENAGLSASNVGRRPRIVKFVPDAYYSFGVEFSIDGVRILLINLDAKIKARRVLPDVDYGNMDTLMEKIRQLAEQMLLEGELPAQKILGIGFALPGTVDEERRLLKVAPNLGLKNVEFSAYGSLFEFPLFIENEANSGAIAELTLGIAKEMRNLVYLSISAKGVGAGIIIGGHLYRGKNKQAGEYGHTNIIPGGKPCSCGRKGCWELYISGNVLLSDYAEKKGEALPGIEAFFEVLKSGDEQAEEVFARYLELLSIGVRDVIFAQDPHYVVLGGVISPFQDFFLEALHEKIFAENNFYTSRDVAVRWATLKENASILGAAWLPIEKIFSWMDYSSDDVT